MLEPGHADREPGETRRFPLSADGLCERRVAQFVADGGKIGRNQRLAVSSEVRIDPRHGARDLGDSLAAVPFMAVQTPLLFEKLPAAAERAVGRERTMP